MKQILEINNLFFEWKEKNNFYLKIRNLNITKNSKVIMFGESGSGKSTLLNLISGILQPSLGTIKVNNTIINYLTQKKSDSFRSKNIGVIFQQFNIIDYISPLTNILLPCYFAGIKKKNIGFFVGRANKFADILGIKKNILYQKRSKDLSEGQKQRIAIIRSIINSPKLILADEPTSALDNVNKKKFLGLLIDICNAEKISLLLVSHDTSINHNFDQEIFLSKLIEKK